MVIHVNPNRVNTPSARPHIGRERKAEEKKAQPKKARAEENFIPEPESLATMIRGALAAFKDGMRWDRGSILNLLV